MAVVLPSEPIESTSAAEKRLHRLLQQLDASWTVLHSVAWQSPDERRHDGEADFVLLHRSHGLVVLEVKGGGVRVENGVWYSTDRHGTEHRVKNPYEQAVASKHALVRFLRSQPGFDFLPAAHVVALPDVVAAALGPAAPPEITWDRTALESIVDALQRSLAHYGHRCDLSAQSIERIAALLLPSVTLRPLLRDRIAVIDESLERLTDQQVRVLEGLRRNRRAVIYGGAGTGKSILAVHRAVRLAEQGFEVLLTCFNQPLANELARRVAGTSVVVSTFHGLCAAQSAQAGLRSTGSTSGWWEVELPAQLATAAERNETAFDAIVVDEGQDFRPDWWLTLQLLLREPDDGPFYVFADTQQAIYVPGWRPPFEGTSWELTVNCRNTVPISALVASVFGEDGPDLGVEGPAPIFRPVESFGEIGEALRKSLHRLLVTERLAPEDVAVLSTAKAVIELCRSRRFGNVQMGPPGPGRVTAETVHRYKGLEAAAVILIVPPDDLVEPSLMYVGLSRARGYIEIIAHPSIGTRLSLEAEVP